MFGLTLKQYSWGYYLHASNAALLGIAAMVVGIGFGVWLLMRRRHAHKPAPEKPERGA